MAQVRTIAVIGAGTMGRGIAHAAALGGYRTILEDLLPGALRKAENEIRTNLDKAVELGVPILDEAGLQTLLTGGPDAVTAVPSPDAQ